MVIVNGEPATNASLNSPMGLCMDKHGNLFIADPLNDVVRLVNPHDSTWIVAGITGAGFSGDGFPAPSAALNHPWAVFVDTSDNLYIADEGNHRIRKVNGATTIISTVVGNGGTGYIGSGDSIMATSTGIGNIYGVWVDNAGNIFFPDAAYNRIKKIDAISHMLYVIADSSANAGFAGDGGRARSALLHAPHTLCLDKAGDIFVADLNNTRIRKMYACTVPVANFTHSGSPVVTFHYSGTTSGVDSVHWHFGDGTTATGTNPIHTYTASGTYSVCATAYTNCDSNTRCSNVVIALTSVGGSTVPAADISVYPNPANNLVHINEVKGHIAYRLTDISGASLLHGDLLQESNTISIQGLAPGIYILELRNDDGQRTMVRIVKQ
jgi:PKD repeat protein